MKKPSLLFAVIGLILAAVMFTLVGYEAVKLYLDGLYNGGSAPVSAAFLYAVPFALVIAVCAAVSACLRKKGK